ncbi:DUF6448 family protein [Trichlorobacter ammonificans]|uniref:Uncharacterized protein n=1 Tax=Trichlorobacter ammonificans TaxID=2916410 RepID=A0ABM9D980_9BACT|nr:DUF6448 family protein [Trichlorobacter ammonificans]CAH2030930.1 conserved exported protein of unknown function [Trichlorobacter ammonificans]
MKQQVRTLMAAALLTAGTALTAPSVFAHCDTLDGPVIQDARIALEKGDVTPVLKWVRKQDEKQVTSGFKKALAVGKLDAARRQKEERHFFELLVKVHRASEGAPYTGVKPAGSVDPAIAAADRALVSGDDAELVRIVTEVVKKGLHERFGKAAASRATADTSVEAGRRYVRDYVVFTHYVEALTSGGGTDHGHDAHPKTERHEKHGKSKHTHDH